MLSITLDRYGHLTPGSEDGAAGLLDANLERAGVPLASHKWRRDEREG
jgi:hypothetical protein